MVEKRQEGTITKAASSIGQFVARLRRWACAYNLAKKYSLPTASSKRKENATLWRKYLGTVKLGGFYNNGAGAGKTYKAVA